MIQTETRLGRTQIIATEGTLIHTATGRACGRRAILLRGQSPEDYHELTAEAQAEATRQVREGAEYKARVTELIRKRYDADDEMAILRQRDTKPEEFAAYNAFAESCKSTARAELAARKAAEAEVETEAEVEEVEADPELPDEIPEE